MTKRLLFILALGVFFACKKDLYESSPKLKLKNVSSTVVPRDGDLQITLRLTDKEGDFNDTIWVKKTTTRCVASNFYDSLSYSIPQETPRSKNFDGDVVISFPYSKMSPRCAFNDTVTMKIWMWDKKGNQSDTVTTPVIIINK
jgi:hypothetical protein